MSKRVTLVMAEDDLPSRSRGSVACNPVPVGRTRRSSTRLAPHRGAYGQLTQFLKEVFLHGSPPLAQEQYQELMAAVESVSAQEEQKLSLASLVQMAQGAGKVNAQSGVSVLRNMGIAVEHDADQIDHSQKSFWDPEDDGEDHAYMPFYNRRLESFLAPGHDDHIQTFLGSENFNAWTFVPRGIAPEHGEDIKLLMAMFTQGMGEQQSMVERYNIKQECLLNWIKGIRGKYLWNPYHNWAHALDVAQLVNYCLTTGMGSKYFNYQDILVLLCASIAHDVGHIGFTNLFLTRTEDPLAIRYNDRSPLENMHSSTFFETLKLENHNFLKHARKGGVAWDGFSTFREKVIGAILATDMKQHLDLVDRFSTRVTKAAFMTDTKEDMGLKKETKADRRMLLEAFLHTADLGHNYKPFDINKLGVQNLEEEWFLQGEREAELGIPISPGFDRSKDSVPSTQSMFMSNVVRPLLEPFTTLFVGEGMRDQVFGRAILENLENNKSTWENAVARHGALNTPILLQKMALEDKDSGTEGE